MTGAKLSFTEKFSYSLGDAASNLFWQTFSFFLLYFYTDVFGLTSAAAGTMFLVARIWDAINDPIMGLIADRTRSKWGKFRPWIIWLAIPFALMGVLTFTTPDFGETGKLIWAYVTYTLMMMIYTGINIPYSALMGVISPSSQERMVASSFRFVAAFAGGLLVQASAQHLVDFFGRGNEQVGWQMTITVYAVLALILWIITFQHTRERVQPLKTQQTTIKQDLKDLLNNSPWIMLFIVGLSIFSYVSIKNGAVLYYFKYYVKDQSLVLFGKVYMFSQQDLVTSYMVIGSVFNIIAVMLTPAFVKKFGKRNTFVGIMFLSSFLSVFFYFFYPENIILMFSLHIMLSFLMGPLAPIQFAMYTDVADYSEWKNGRRATGLVMAASSMAQKVAWAIGGFASGWLLYAFGFVANVEQSPQTLHGIRLMMSIIPAACMIYGAGLMFFYKLDSDMMKKIEADLLKMRAQNR